MMWYDDLFPFLTGLFIGTTLAALVSFGIVMAVLLMFPIPTIYLVAAAIFIMAVAGGRFITRVAQTGRKHS